MAGFCCCGLFLVMGLLPWVGFVMGLLLWAGFVHGFIVVGGFCHKFAFMDGFWLWICRCGLFLDVGLLP